MASIEFSKLEKDHKGFLMPQFKVNVGGSDIKTEDFPIIDINVLMSASYDMSSCEFTIAGMFDQKNGKFSKDIFTQFKPGKVIDVKMGYSTPKGVFKGYINSIAFDFNGQSGPYITVSCLDAKGALVNNRTWKNYGKQTIKSIVTEILKEKCSTYATISGVESDFDKGDTGAYAESPEIKENMDDFHYIKMFAIKTNNSFCVIYDKLYFCENLAQKAKAGLKLTWGKNLLSFSSEVNLSDQIGSVQVYGDDPITQKTFEASAKSDAIKGAGESGADMAPVVKAKTMVIVDPDVTNQSQAEELAKDTLQSHASKLLSCKGSTIGIPEIVAGDKIEIDGMGNGLDGEYFLEKVTHRINGQGYITSFEGINPKVKTG